VPVTQGVSDQQRADGPDTVFGPIAPASSCEEHPMLRTLLCAALALVLFTGLAEAAKKRAAKGKVYHGKIVKVDAAEGTLTVQVKKDEKEFKVTAKTPVECYNADGEKTELTGKDVLKKEQFKKGAHVTIICDNDDNVKKITIGKKKK
jgi:hypothetical protein